MPPSKALSKVDIIWLKKYQKLVEYKERCGHCNVPSKDPDLGGWVRNQRKANNKNILRKDRKRKLDFIGFNWDPKQTVRKSRSEAAWEVMHQKLVEFHGEHGHCKLPSLRELQKADNEETKQLKKLLNWTHAQRVRRKATDTPSTNPAQEQRAKGSGRIIYKPLSQRQIDLMDKLGFEWILQDFDKIWDEKFSELEEFKAQQGDCLVPQSHPQLGTWVNCQRRRYQQKKLEEDRIKKLESVGFVWYVQKGERKSEKWDDIWEKHYQLLLQYKQQHGDLFVPNEYTCGDGCKLGPWVASQRQRRDVLSKKRVALLNEVGFVWDTTKQIWWNTFELLKEFHKKHGHCHVPRSTDKSLKEWTQAQRDRRKGRVEGKTGKLKYLPITEEQVRALDSLDFPWSGDGSHEKNDSEAYKKYQEHLWKEGFEKLKQFKEVHGHCLATKNSDASASNWIKNQRSLYKEGQLIRERIDLLESIGFNDWTGQQLKRAKAEAGWKRRFEELKEFRRIHGHCRVPGAAERKPEDEERLSSLYSWISLQRERRFNRRSSDKRPLKQNEIDQLNSIDFIWDVGLDARWVEKFRRLRRYKMEHGDCLVPNTYDYDQELAYWVTNQRTEYRNGNISSDRVARLDAVGFVWRVVHKAGDPNCEEYKKKWELKYEKLQLFKDEFGHCLVPGDYKQDKSLGRWVSKQRTMLREKRMTEKRKQMLDEIGFVWKVDFYQSEKSTQQQHWDEMFVHLKDYKEEFGNLNIRHDHQTKGGTKLGQWVSLQRSNFNDGTIDEKRKARLEDVGFFWKAAAGVSAASDSAGPDADVLGDTSDDESVAASRPKKRLKRLRINEVDGTLCSRI